MELRLNGHVLPISHLGPDYLILRNSAEHPPADAEIMLSIDGHESRWSVWLADGVSAERRRTRITAVPAANGSSGG